MKIDSEDIRRLYQAYAAEKVVEREKGCPSPEDLSSLIQGELPRKHKKNVLRHIGFCIDCAINVRHLLAMDSNTRRFTREIFNWKEGFISGKSPLGLLRIRVSTSSLILASVFFIGLLSLTAGLFFFFSQDGQITESANQFRGDQAAVWKDASPVLEQISRNQLVFKWHKFSDWDHYILELFDPTMNMIWKSPNLNNERYSLPLAQALKLEARKDYFWLVTVVLKNGSAIESPLFTFQLSD